MHRINLEDEVYIRLQKIAQAQGKTIHVMVNEWAVDHEKLLGHGRLPPPPPIDKSKLAEVLARIHEADPFSKIKDPLAWQKKVRKDRDLPFRQ